MVMKSGHHLSAILLVFFDFPDLIQWQHTCDKIANPSFQFLEHPNTVPFQWYVLKYKRIDVCKETVKEKTGLIQNSKGPPTPHFKFLYLSWQENSYLVKNRLISRVVYVFEAQYLLPQPSKS